MSPSFTKENRMVLITAKQIVKPGKLDDFLKTVKPLIEGSNSEEGCIEYILYKNTKDSNVLTFVEKWKDMDAVKAHQKAPHYVEIVPKLKPFLDGGDVAFYEPV